MIVREEVCRQKVEKDKEQVIVEVNESKQVMVKTKSKLDDLVEKNGDLDSTYVTQYLGIKVNHWP